LFPKLSIKQSEIQKSKFHCLSEVTPYHHNVFTFTLFLPEGRAGVAWEPSNKMMLFLPPREIKCLSLHPLISCLNLLFVYPSHISLSLSLSVFKRAKTKCILRDSGSKSPVYSQVPWRHKAFQCYSVDRFVCLHKVTFSADSKAFRSCKEPGYLSAH
jgi:hypothetical protein